MHPFKFFRAALVVCLCCLTFFVTICSQTQSTNATHSISDLSWMTGDWQTPAGGRVQIDEHWTQSAGGSMLGMSRTVAGDKTVEFEYLRIEQREDGIYYVAHPKARCPGTDFKLTRLSSSEAVFENPQHDFPTRIIYRRNADGSLLAAIEGTRNGQTTRVEYPYVPATCGRPQTAQTR